MTRHLENAVLALFVALAWSFGLKLADVDTGPILVLAAIIFGLLFAGLFPSMDRAKQRRAVEAGEGER